MQLRFVTLALACLAVTGCTIGAIPAGDFPTAPTPQPPRATRLTITPVGGGNILVGANPAMATSGTLAPNSIALGAYAEYNSGPGRYVQATWTSSDDSVLAVADHVLIARKRGAVTLTASFEGLSDSEEFTVDAGFFGRWSGASVVEQCTGSTGSMQDVLCRPPSGGRAGMAAIGATWPFAIEIPETSGEDITARVSLGSATGVVSGKNRGGGYFGLLGEITGQGNTITFVDWNMRAAQDVMEGVATFQVRINGVSGLGVVQVRLLNVTRQ
jgi:hypothetical protein